MLRARVVSALVHLKQPTPTLVATHAGVIRTALATGDSASDFAAKIDFGGFITMTLAAGAQS
jgi:broad specificity phosphatase PhoE